MYEIAKNEQERCSKRKSENFYTTSKINKKYTGTITIKFT